MMTQNLLLHCYTPVRDTVVIQQLLKKVVTDHNLIWKVGALNVASYNSFFKVTNQHIIVNGFHKIILWAADTLFHLTSITVHFPCLTLNMEIPGGRGWGGGGKNPKLWVGAKVFS